ncbi:unnamed protein product [Rhizoctonia solani]|uniref:F-box domain-containing protein n=1 Tax=Rhizoctonia solani TaxID=456999 RepID=A0A8H3C7X8_9AGAM|nr:unnamed protein product [Rhizoctonia solani]
MIRLFEIPELLCLICEQSQRSDLARLLTTSRLFFECAVPFVWRDLPESAPMILLKLLPNADTYLDNRLNATLVETQIQNLKPLDAQSLVRFNLYAAYVKRIIRHRRNKQSNVAWDRLLKLVDARPILPNLEILRISLSVAPYLKSISTHSAVSYLGPYLSPNLYEIDGTCDRDRYLYLEPQDLTQLISRISLECPRLSSLKFRSMTGHTATGPVNGLLADSLGQLRYLRSIRLGLAVIDPEALTSLGTLPYLESLSLNESYPGSNDTPKTPSAPMPNASFAALRHLGISLRFDFKIGYHIWGITALVRRLTSVSLRVFGYTTRTGICDFINTIHRSSPLVTSLYIDCTNSLPIALLSSRVIRTLNQLPLQHLRLSGKDGPEGRYGGGERSRLRFPHMECLQIRGYDFSFRHLASMTKYMPRLQYLSVPVKLDVNWPPKHELPSTRVHLTPSPSQLELHILSDGTTPRYSTMARCEIPDEEIEVIAAGLHALWPSGVTCTTYRRSHKDSEVSWTDRVNAELKQLRETDAFSLPQTEVTPRKHFGKRIPSWLEQV